MAITAADDLDGLLGLLRDSEPRLNVRHLDAALSRLARLAGCDRVRDSPDSGGPSANTAGRRHNSPSASITNEARVAVGAGAARAAAARLVSAVLPLPLHDHERERELSPRDCASLLASIARLAPPNTAAASGAGGGGGDVAQAAGSQVTLPVPLLATATALAERLLATRGSASLRDRVALLHAAARLRLALPGRELVALLRGMDRELAMWGKPQDVSMALWALATMGLAPPPAWLSRLTAGLPPDSLAGWGAQALANSAWALAKLGFRPRAEWLAGLVGASRQHIKACQTQELVNLLWALAVQGHRPPAAWLDEALAALHERAPGLNAQRLVARALAVRREMGPQLPGFGPRELSTLLYGMALLRLRPDGRWLDQLLAEVERHAAAELAAGPAGAGEDGDAGALLAEAMADSAAVEPHGSGEVGRAAAAEASRQSREPPPSPDSPSASSTASSSPRLPSPSPGGASDDGRGTEAGSVAASTPVGGGGTDDGSAPQPGPQPLRLQPHLVARLAEGVFARAVQPPALEAGSAACTSASSTGGRQPRPTQLAQHRPQEAGQQRGEERQQHRPQGGDGGGGGVAGAGRLGPPQLAVVLWAVAELGHAPTEAWLLAMARLVAARLEEFGPPEAAVTVRALQQLSTAAAKRGRAAAPRTRRRSRPSGGAATAGPSAAITAGGGGSDGGGSCREVVTRLAARLAGSLPERSLYGAMRAAALVSGPSYATAADQVLLDVYSVRSLALLGGPQLHLQREAPQPRPALPQPRSPLWEAWP
ncbi:hypothetical protein GPECTOR_7g1289 [Gonium pectorale]|uniref:FAST kinase leucine-rich domain-containing protein n=1 Tax=Gonium pectorale TaxID=33097 RepID=A0A150GUG8_GONPE|nr:hypothetical protein GPECTOR_7g1289 [Gonium pectorale]|eukprot:KXZ53393.1 hypothetical protein GPECTOR_7g1289 [Gonium pectorale]